MMKLHPTFVIIGAQKAATRWLRHNLGRHPEISVADHEVGFFHLRARYRCGSAWYAAHFTDWAGEAIVGEATPAYLMWHHDPAMVARRMERFDAELSPIAILRNPVDRAYSAYVHHLRLGRLPPEVPMMEVFRSRVPELDPLGLISGGWYAACLGPYLDRFGDQTLVLFHDEIRANAGGAYDRTLAHLGAGPYQPDGLTNLHNAANAPAGSALARDDGIGYRPLDDEVRAELFRYFRRDVAELEALLGIDLSDWDPEVSASAAHCRLRPDRPGAAAGEPPGSPAPPRAGAAGS